MNQCSHTDPLTTTYRKTLPMGLEDYKPKKFTFMAYLAPRSVDCILGLTVDTKNAHSTGIPKKPKWQGSSICPRLIREKALAYRRGFMVWMAKIFKGGATVQNAIPQQ